MHLRKGTRNVIVSVLTRLHIYSILLKAAESILTLYLNGSYDVCVNVLRVQVLRVNVLRKNQARKQLSSR